MGPGKHAKYSNELFCLLQAIHDIRGILETNMGANRYAEHLDKKMKFFSNTVGKEK